MPGTTSTLPRNVPPFEKMKIGDKSLPPEMSKALAGDVTNLYDLRDFILNLFVDNETPSGTQDGVNKTFTLQFSPMPPESLKLFVSKMASGAGVLQIFGVDYILTGATIRYQTAPSNNDVIRAYYRRRMTQPGASVAGDASMPSGSVSPPAAGGGSSPGGGGGGSGAGGPGILMGSQKFQIFDAPGFARVF